jgi:ankyrin repeat protein
VTEYARPFGKRLHSAVVLLAVVLTLSLGCGTSPREPSCDVVLRGHLTLAAKLVEQGAAVDARGENGQTCLMVAAARNDPDGVNFLLSSGADPNLQSTNGQTALIHAALSGDIESVQLLFEAGADSNHRARDGLTPLKAAIEGEHDEIAEMLRQAGAER